MNLTIFWRAWKLDFWPLLGVYPPGLASADYWVLSCLPGASLVPRRLPGCPNGPFLHPCCLIGASQAVQLVLSCRLPGAFVVLPSLSNYSSPFLPPWCLPGCPTNPFLRQITGVSWFCLGRLLESSDLGNLGRSPKP